MNGLRTPDGQLDWNDVRFFLAVARRRTLAGAADLAPEPDEGFIGGVRQRQRARTPPGRSPYSLPLEQRLRRR